MLPVILDMDPGVDDALALLLALGLDGLEVRAVTTVSGNVPVEVGADNALRVLELAGADGIPVFAGAARPWEGAPRHAQHIHGEGGLGEAHLPVGRRQAAGDAWSCLHEVLGGQQDELTVIATGPLTNLALVETEHPGLLRRARRVIVMGGAVHAPGNVTPTAEFNFWADPVAANIVLRAGASVLLVPLDATRRALVSESELAALTADAGDIGRFARAAARTPIAVGRQAYGTDGIVLHDPLTIALAALPELGRPKRGAMQVEVRGRVTAGQVVMDERTFTDPGQQEGTQVEWVDGVDRAAFLEVFAEGLRVVAARRESTGERGAGAAASLAAEGPNG